MIDLPIRVFVLSLVIACGMTPVSGQFGGESKRIQGHHSLPGKVLPTSAPAPTPALISHRKPDGLILSTGNLYFTSHDAAGATVWRTGQGSSPGQEAVLYWEAGATFGDIVFAKVDGRFFGYFFATKGTGKDVTIKRVPLTGGSATVLATMTSIDVQNNRRNLVTDGANLYWQDVVSVRKMSIRGGPITVLDSASDNTPTAGIALQGNNVIYASVADIRFVPTSGTATPPSFRTIVTAAGRVSALHAVSNGVYWGDQGGGSGIHLRVGSTTTNLSSPGGLVTSISSSGSAAGGVRAWTECSGACRLNLKFLFFNRSIAIADDPLGVTVTSSRNVFWGDAAGVHRQKF